MDAILVTGGAGYIGAHACKALFRAGYLPVAYDNLSTGHKEAVQWGPLVHEDLRDQKVLEETFLRYQPKAVLHFAASALVIESIKDPGKYYENNIGATLSLLKAMCTHGVSFLVFSSTCAIYGQGAEKPLEETSPIAPINPYGRSKWMIEQIVSDFEKAHGIHSVSLRYFNVGGADLEGDIGENHETETHLIPSVIQVALGVKKEIVVYGTDFASRDGSAVRDYIHVSDLVRAHLLALEWLIAHRQSAQMNLGTGTGHSVLEIIEAVQTFSSRKLPVRLEKKREGEPAQLTANNTKAQKLLGWSPHLSDLSTLVRSAWTWHAKLLTVPNNVQAESTLL